MWNHIAHLRIFGDNEKKTLLIKTKSNVFATGYCQNIKDIWFIKKGVVFFARKNVLNNSPTEKHFEKHVRNPRRASAILIRNL